MASPPPRPQPQTGQEPAVMAGSFRVARVLGFDILIHWSWLIVFALLTWSLASGYLPDEYPDWTARQRWATGAVTTVLFFISILAHELSHSVVARRQGLTVRSITLFIFGGVSSLSEESRSARDEFWVAVVGPVMSFIAGALFFALWLFARANNMDTLKVISGYLAEINVAVGIFNLLPGFPLDGGRVLRAAVWGVKHNMLEATRVASNVGRAFAGLLIVLGILSVLIGQLGGLWLVFVGWFLWNSAEASYAQLVVQRGFTGLIVGPAVEQDISRIPPDVSLRRFAHDYVLRQNRRVFFVSPVEHGDIQGLITLGDLHRVPDEQWDQVSVYRAMTPRDRLVTVTPRTSALEALQLMAKHNVNQLVVMDGWEPIGVLSRAGLISAIQLRNEIREMEDREVVAGGAETSGPDRPAS